MASDRKDRKHDTQSRTTRRMGSADLRAPADDEITLIDAPRPGETHESEPPGGVEVEYVLEATDRTTGAVDSTMVEIWTRNRIYRIDASLRCTEVVLRATGKREPPTKAVGARLAGGERRGRKGGVNMRFYFPLPVPGSEAVFCDAHKRHERIARTSTIERVVLKLHEVQFRDEHVGHALDEFTGRFQPVPR